MQPDHEEQEPQERLVLGDVTGARCHQGESAKDHAPVSIVSIHLSDLLITGTGGDAVFDDEQMVTLRAETPPPFANLATAAKSASALAAAQGVHTVAEYECKKKRKTSERQSSQSKPRAPLAGEDRGLNRRRRTGMQLNGESEELRNDKMTELVNHYHSTEHEHEYDYHL